MTKNPYGYSIKITDSDARTRFMPPSDDMAKATRDAKMVDSMPPLKKKRS